MPLLCIEKRRAVFRLGGNLHEVTETQKTRNKGSANSTANSFNKFPGITSGPGDFVSSSFSGSCRKLGSVMTTASIVGISSTLKTANVRGRLSSFWRQAALAALRNQSRVNQAPVDSKPVNASLSILNELFPESWPTANQVERWQDSFQNLLQDEDGLRVFREFLRGEFSDENIEFWIACQQYKSLEVGTKSRVQAQRIYDEFIAFQSHREVNLDCETRLQTESRLSEAGPDLFDTCQRRIEALMEKDPYIRFLRSTLYYKLKEVTGVSGTASAHQNSISTTVLDYGHPNKLVTSSPLHHDTPLVLCLPQISIPAKPVASRSPAYRVKEDVSNKGLAKDANETAFGAPYSPFLDAIIVHSSSCSPSVISLRRKTRGNHEQARHSIDLSHMAIQ
ncbi:unnamed protein product [Schistocephalus solidus]|uniref:RGS domain-containing protein n=1 Tax=Schistocephalus solidus TaxID=70667 RepID=A0A183SGA9_SCHSO|nr:unnamed protein product [Schistocephalus solidus]